MTTHVRQLDEAGQCSSALKESPQSVGGPAHIGPFAALQNRDYLLFFIGSLISNIGTWMQTVAQGWLVVTLTDSEFYLGVVGFFAMAPTLLFSLLGGVLADRVDKRRILMATYLSSAILVAILTTLIHTGRVELWHVLLISFGTGTCVAFSSPSWQAIVSEIVDRRTLMNAIALNSVQFNLTRILGPSLGGLVVQIVGIAGAYYFNVLSYVPFLLILPFIRLRHMTPKNFEQPKEGLWQSLHQAFDYIRSRPILRTLVILAVLQTLFLFPYTTLLPIFAKDVLNMGAGGYALLLAAAGVGAFAGALMLTLRRESKHKARWLLISQIVFAVGIAIFGASTWIATSLAALVVVGWSFVTFLATGNTLLQTLTPGYLRGRVMSIWMLAGLGPMPVGSLLAGSVASLTSPAVTLVLGAIATMLLSVYVVRPYVHALWSGAAEAQEQV